MKLKRKLGVLLVVATAACVFVGVIGAGGLNARSRDDYVEPNYPLDNFVHDVGNFGNVVFNNMAIGGQGSVTPSGEYPLGSDISYLYYAQLWFGDDEKVIHGDYFGVEWYPLSPIYNTNQGTTKPLPSSFGSYEGVDFSWMTPFWREDHPTRVSDQDGHWYANDSQSAQTFGLDIMSQSMAWSAPGHDEWLTVLYFIHYNGSAALKPNTYMAFAYDIDCAWAYDDIVMIDGNDPGIDEYNNVTWADGGDGIPDEYDSINYPIAVDGDASIQPYYDHFNQDSAPRLMGIMANGVDNPGESGYVAVRILRAVMNPGINNGDTLSEREYIVTASHSWDINNDPANDAYKYAYMVDTGTFEEITNPYDWRVCPSIGPLETVDEKGMQPGDVLEVRMCWLVGEGLTGVRKNADQAMSDALGFNGKFDDPRAGEEVDDFIVLSPPTSPLLGAVTGDGTVTLRFDPQVTPEINCETEMDMSTGFQIDLEGYLIYRASTLDQLGDASDLRPWFETEGNVPGDLPEGQGYNVGGDEPRYLRSLLARWDKDINDWSHWVEDPNNPNNPDYPHIPGDPYYADGDGSTADGDPASLRAPGFETNDNDQYDEFTTLNNWDDIFADPTDGEGYAPGSTSIYEYVDDGTHYHDYDKWPEDDHDVSAPSRPRNHFTYYYSVVAYDYGASPIYNSNIGSKPLPALEGGVRANYVEVTLTSGVQGDLEDVLVVPNPYVGGVDWQTRSLTGVVERKMAFTNLPSRCTIRIYTIAGDLVDIIEHNDATTGTAWWDLQSRNSMEIASGVYVYHIDAPGIGTKIGKFAVLMGERI